MATAAAVAAYTLLAGGALCTLAMFFYMLLAVWSDDHFDFVDRTFITAMVLVLLALLCIGVGALLS